MAGASLKIYQDGHQCTPPCDHCSKKAVAVGGFEKGTPERDGRTEWAGCSDHLPTFSSSRHVYA